MTYGLLFVCVVLCLGIIGMALILIGDGSDPRDWLGEDDAPTSTAPVPDPPPALRPITSDRSHYLDHVSRLSPLQSEIARRASVERLEASTTTRGPARINGSARLSPRDSHTQEGVSR